MSRTNSSIWYSLGRAFESTVGSGLGASTRSGSGGSPRGRSARGESSRNENGSGPAVVGLVAGGVTAAVVGAVRRLTREHRPSPSRLARGAFAGAGAAGLVLLGRHLLERTGDDSSPAAKEVGDELMAGAGRGLVYASLLDPYLPGPPILRGVLAGTADYFAAPLGGLFSRLQALSPVRRIPVLSILLETGDAEDDPILEFLAYGVLLGLLLGDEPGSLGEGPD